MFRKSRGRTIVMTTSLLFFFYKLNSGKMNKKILVACECSQVVTKAFRAAGDLAFSCDLEQSYGGHPEWHIKADVRTVLFESWDLVIAHPPCTFLSKVSAVAWRSGKHKLCEIWKAKQFFMMFTQLKCPTAIENPIPLRMVNLPKPTQWICPSMFGHPYTKKTGLWLYDLPPLLPMRATQLNTMSWVRHAAGNPKARSKFFEYIAESMAAQWG